MQSFSTKTKLPDISGILQKEGADGYLMHGNIHDADIYYATHFLASDSFSYLLCADSEVLLVSDMEKGRADIESRVSNENILMTSDFNYREKAKELKNGTLAYAAVLKEMLDRKNVKTIAVSYDFPAYYFDQLRKNFDVVLIKTPFEKNRTVKSDFEVSCIEQSQNAAEKAMEAAVSMIRRSAPNESGALVLDNEILTGERVLQEIDRTLLENGCVGDETIVSCGEDSANPHGKTLGTLFANQPIVIDIFPQNKQSRYFGDMTRTVIKGEALPELQKMYEAVRGAQEAGVQTAKPGASCKDVHNTVCDYLENSGFHTYRSGSKVGFIHTTGHGVGLDIHEMPNVSENDYVLEPGNVITVEPGLYYPGIGGIRIEDTVVITKNGCRNLNRMEKRFEV
ncbi:Methionine aminopeptidase 1, mitochondrial [Methanosarcinaceae archaeon Ag5]|uniref:Methionine aminopeptidase 1, mitochondrial n=1 Tax=Methanolapillus africanus TaxID=3028297 RepID=A0AAE4ML87_9EURY|nr:Methionine aminopeptidase 1, mitochondrial [Methanosarcinaceae archaeon Ag5]